MIPVILEVAISLIVVFFLMSTLVSFINEIIALAISSRGATLKNALHELLEEGKKQTTGLVNDIYQSPHIHKLRIFSWLDSKGYLPANISASGFTNALITSIHKADHFDLPAIQQSVDGLSNEFLRTHLKKLIAELDADKKNLTGLKQKIEAWFNDYMESVTRVYKLRTRVIVAIISFIVCLSMNIDSIALMQYFWQNKEKREMMVKFAGNLSETDYKIDTVKVVSITDTNGKTILDTVALTDREKSDALMAKRKMLLQDLNTFDLPIGYQNNPVDWDKKGAAGRFFLMLLGMVISAFCLTLGAPFWFDLMKKMVNARNQISSGKKLPQND